jgi:type VI secretion system secreted protein VgrG
MPNPPENAVAITLKIDSVVGEIPELLVVSFTGHEEISRLFEFRVTVAARIDPGKELKLSSVVGEPALLTISGASEPRYVSGIVCRAFREERRREFQLYRLDIVPAVHRLKLRSGCRIFQNVSFKEIVSRVLSEGGLSKQEFEFIKESEEPPKRDYCVQYRESDWAFVARLLEEEGYCFFFEHSATRHVLKIGNQIEYHPPIPGKAEGNHAIGRLLFKEPGVTLPAAEHVFGYSEAEEMRPDRVTLRDYNHRTPKVTLEAAHPARGEAEEPLGDAFELGLYDYPGGYQKEKEGERIAKLRHEEEQVERVSGRGASDCPRRIPGHYFSKGLLLEERTDAPKLLVVSVRHQATKQSDIEAGGLDPRCLYENTFTTIPRKIPFRPRRTTARPEVRGPQTAVVVGPKEEEIYVDELGRVKVRFHWDRRTAEAGGGAGERGVRGDGTRLVEGENTCWIRVAQLWAGAGWGALFTPRVGHEVVVQFLEGDPDRPLIVGSVYNEVNRPPYALPKRKTVSTIKSASSPGEKGHNELRFEDKRGAEEIYLHAQLDMNTKVERDESDTVGQDRKRFVGRDETVLVGHNREAVVNLDEKVAVLGHEEVFNGSRHIVVAGDNTEEIVKGADTYTLKLGNRTETLDKGHYTTKVYSGNREVEVAFGHHTTKVRAGNAKLDVASGDAKTEVSTGNYYVDVQVGKVKIMSDTEITLECGSSSITLKPTGVVIEATKIDLKGTNISADAATLLKLNGTLLKLNCK